MNKQDKNNQIIIYNTEDGQTKIEVQMKDETVWLTQAQMADLFQKTVPTINEHIKNVFLEEVIPNLYPVKIFRCLARYGLSLAT